MPRTVTPLLQKAFAAYPRPEPGFEQVDEERSKLIAQCPVKKEGLPKALRVDARVLQRVSKNWWYKMPPRVFYGLGLNYADCLDYYLTCDALPDQRENMTASDLVTNLVPFIENHLSKASSHSLSLINTMSNNYELVLALYSNHDIEYTELEATEEKEVLDILRKELPWVFEQQEPRWFVPWIRY